MGPAATPPSRPASTPAWSRGEESDMPRVKDAPASRRRRKKILDRATGYVGGHRKLLRTAADAVNRAGKYAYRDRRNKRREFRALWIIRVNAAAREEGLSYSRFMAGLRKAGVE